MGILQLFLQKVHLGWSEVPPFTCGQVTEFNVHDADPFQGLDLITEDLAHAPDLAVQPLFEYDAKAPGFGSFVVDVLGGIWAGAG